MDNVIENESIIELENRIQGFITKKINPVIQSDSTLSVLYVLMIKRVINALIPVGGK